jgi:hypothetical protein
MKGLRVTKRGVKRRKLPKGAGVVAAALTGFAVGTGVVLKGREAATAAANAVLSRAEKAKP